MVFKFTILGCYLSNSYYYEQINLTKILRATFYKGLTRILLYPRGLLRACRNNATS